MRSVGAGGVVDSRGNLLVPCDLESDALYGAAARLRQAAIGHAWRGCPACGLLRQLGDEEVAALLLRDALRQP